LFDLLIFFDLQGLYPFIQFHGNHMNYSKESDGLRSVRHFIAVDMILFSGRRDVLLARPQIRLFPGFAKPGNNPKPITE
jgi:hypothetical protein